MIAEGVKLMAVGMGTVFFFLWLMIMCICLVAVLTRKHALQELESMQNERNKATIAKRKASHAKSAISADISTESDNVVTAIIAAIAAFEAEKLRNC